ncbi:hypothetical protein Adt_39290 [Abeliophyllum distichum]|uniref:Uncharacterized protein n=1 Tax=Abeliophyllum distichum TaxID=126358 RepID=A0ABD1Q4N7_9LAMI
MMVHQRWYLTKIHFTRDFILIQDRNQLCKELLAMMERYRIVVEEYKKKVNDMTTLVKHVEAEVQRRSKDVEEYKKKPKAERLRANVHCLAFDFGLITFGLRREKRNFDKRSKRRDKK